ncbi:MAG: lipoyl synthase [Myxococcota bacterium]
MPRFTIVDNRPRPKKPKPRWLKVKAPVGPRYEAIGERLENLNLHTVCQEASCPNIGECWGSGTATIMLMGGTCTRGCRFCNVITGKPAPLDPDEPRNAAEAVHTMGVDYIVLTSVNRDDLPDGGADHFAQTVEHLKAIDPGILVEVLVPDFQGRMEGVERLIEAGPEVIAHNVETVRSLTRRVRDARASFDQSLAVLEHIQRAGRGRAPGGVDILAKTSLMLGLGETEDEVVECLRELRSVGTHVVTFGQYLRPSPRHIEVAEFVSPEQFDRYADVARDMGFVYVASGPLVRSSYKAGEFYLEAHIDRMREQAGAAS